MPKNSSRRAFTRRDFLKISALGLGAYLLATVGLNRTAEPVAEPVEVETPSFQFGKENSMNQRILVTYATRTGSTVGVASAIGETLSERGFAVDVIPMKDHPVVEGYHSVVIGSAVNGAQWLPEAVEYVKNHQQSLAAVPLALFCVHIMNLGDDEGSRKRRLAYLDNVRVLVKPAEEAYFAGVGINPAEMSWFERTMARLFKITAEGDCRDWDKIRGWAGTVFG